MRYMTCGVGCRASDWPSSSGVGGWPRMCDCGGQAGGGGVQQAGGADAGAPASDDGPSSLTWVACAAPASTARPPALTPSPPTGSAQLRAQLAASPSTAAAEQEAAEEGARQRRANELIGGFLDRDESRSAATAAAHAQEFLPFLAARGAVAGEGSGAGATGRHPRNEGAATPFATPPSGTPPLGDAAASQRRCCHPPLDINRHCRAYG
jgi:hypothetical protein